MRIDERLRERENARVPSFFRCLVFNFKTFPSDSGHETRDGSDVDVKEIAVHAFKAIDHDMTVYK